MLQQRQHFEATIKLLEDNALHLQLHVKQANERSAKMRLMAEK